MLETRNHGCFAKMKKKLEALVSSSENVVPRLAEVLRDTLVAISYADNVLMASSVNALRSCLADSARDIIQGEVMKSKTAKEVIKKIWQEDVDGAACEDFDEIKNEIESLIDGRIASMTEVRDKIVKTLEEKEYHVENAHQLEDGIRELRQFRENLLKDWPPSGQVPSPLNKEAIAEARKAIANGGNGMKKSELVWGPRKID
jgi:hypothetical protein